MSSLVAAASLAARGSGGRSSVSGVSAAVFGATGFLGRYVVNQLGRIGSQVTAPFRGDELQARHLRPMGDLGQVVPVAFEARDDDSVRRAVEGASVVVNLTGKHYETRNYSYDDVHREFAGRLAAIAADEGVPHLVHVSALPPARACNSRWLSTKMAGEAAVRAEFPAATFVRPADMFGAEDRFLTRMARDVLMLPAVPLANLGESRVQPVWVNDVAAVVAAAARDPETYAGKTLELAGPNVLTVEDCYKFVMDKTRRQATFVPIPSKVAELVQFALNFRLPMLNPSPVYSHDLVRMEVADPILDTEKAEDVLRFDDLDAVALSMDSDIAVEILRRFRKGGDRSSLFYVD